MKKEIIALRDGEITIDKLLKLSGITDTGGQALLLIREGIVKINGVTVTEKRKKVRLGDVVTVDSRIELNIVSEEQ